MTELYLHDSMTREKRPFTPIDPNAVQMYVCGPTVYNHAHIGNFRAAVVFDLLFRLLRHLYGDGHVRYARNFTDIDDKIIQAAKQQECSISEITETYTRIYREETAALNILPPNLEPTATGHIDQMIAMIARLIEVGAAYAAEGHVLFDTNAYAEYGALARVSQDDMIAGARVEVAPYKKNPADFVLWKPAAQGEPGWDSPWGRGRPGWHLECSAMIAHNLGATIDIHGGGQDLRFPHHENEIAQSVCAHEGTPLANYWVHNGFLRMGSDKMSKSLGNIVLVRDLLKEWPGEVIRWALLSAQYRQPLEWTDGLLEQAKKQLDRFYRLLEETPIDDSEAVAPPQSIVLALCDDLNSPAAFAGLHELRDIVAQTPPERRSRAVASLKAAGALMGFFQIDPAHWFRQGGKAEGLSDAQIEEMIAARAKARAEKDYAQADRIRDELSEAGIILEDKPGGAGWRRQ